MSNPERRGHCCGGLAHAKRERVVSPRRGSARASAGILAVVLSLAFASAPNSAGASSAEESITRLLASGRPAANAAQPKGRPSAPDEEPLVGRTSDDYLRFVRARPGHVFPNESATSQDSRAAAYGFLRRNRDLLMAPDPRLDFVHRRSRRQGDRAIERFEQTYDGLSVFGSHVTVQLDASGHVEALMSDIARDPAALREEGLSTAPALSGREAVTFLLERWESEGGAEPSRRPLPC